MSKLDDAFAAFSQSRGAPSPMYADNAMTCFMAGAAAMAEIMGSSADAYRLGYLAGLDKGEEIALNAVRNGK